MNDLQIFNYEGMDVRTVQKDGDTWFVLKDVCEVLDITNNRDAAARLDEDEKDDVGITDAIGRQQNTTVINESGLYSTILLSRKPEAKMFKRWITHEVLPQIRKTGSYIKPMTPAELIAAQAQQMVEMERKVNTIDAKVKSVDDKLTGALDVFSAPPSDDWRSSMNDRINQICKNHGLSYQVFRHELYLELEATARCNLEARKTNLIKRMKRTGATTRECKAISKIDVVDRDAKLRAIFESIVRKHQAKYAVREA